MLPYYIDVLVSRLLPTLITISSSSIDSLCDSCSACLLPTVHPGNMPYIRTDPTLSGGSRLVAGSSIFTILHFYLGRSRILQSSYTSRRLTDRIRITVSWNTDQVLYLPRTIAYTTKQLRQQASSRSYPHNGWMDTDQEKEDWRPDRRDYLLAIGIPVYD